MFYSAIINEGVRKIDALDHQDDQSFWIKVDITSDIGVYFSVLNEQTGPFGRIVSALTESGVYHAETWIGDNAPAGILSAAESRLGLPYDFEGMLGAWKDIGYHTPGMEFCSGLTYELLQPILPGLQPYPSPGKLLSQLAMMAGREIPILAAHPQLITGADFDYLQSLVPDKIATGTFQEILALLT